MPDESEANHAASPKALFRPGLEDETPEGEAARRAVAEIIIRAKTPEFYAPGVALGYCCRNSPVIAGNAGHEAPPRSATVYRATRPAVSRPIIGWAATCRFTTCSGPG